MASPRDHVEEIRREKFSIGGRENALAEDLHQAVKNLSAELYAKDVHFLMELIQNAEDNEYSEGVGPSLEFVITSKDITDTGAPATLLIFNNEIGFSRNNIESLCSVGRSTKKDRKKGFIGEKGIGFKSVFIITSTPFIFSNGYQIRFNEKPCNECGLGYIVPEWVNQNPTLSQIQEIYTTLSSSKTLPTTTLVLPLKPDKVNPVKTQLSAIHPQVLLFLSKIKRLSVRRDESDSSLSSVSEVAIVKETDYLQRKNIDAESFTIHLAAGGDNDTCSFYMWRQKFPVQPSCRVERRCGVDEWTVTLAFPLGEAARNESTPAPGIYSFLPTEMVTGFPFMIQADFVLSSSRETILLDNPWNRGILEQVPTAFVDAFKSLVKANPDAPLWNLPAIFQHLPVDPSSYPELNVVRASIKTRLANEPIVPSETATAQRLFHFPRDVGRLTPSFWTVLSRARKDGVSLSSLSSHGKFIIAECFDAEQNDRFLNFLGVEAVNAEWYGKCIQGSRLVEGLSEEGYLELLSFVSNLWTSHLQTTNLRNIPLLKFQDLSGKVSLTSLAGSSVSRDGTIFISRSLNRATWLIDWNRELGCPGNRFFVPKPTQDAIHASQNQNQRDSLLRWLQSHAKISSIDVCEYASLLCGSLRERKPVILFAHFLSNSSSDISRDNVISLCRQMPIVDNYGNVVTSRLGVLVPANGSKWAGLVGSNAWRENGFVELSEDYLSPAKLAGKVVSSENELSGFLRDQARAQDVPNVTPPNSPIAAASSPLTKENAFLILEWVRNHRSLPGRFSASLSSGSWLRVTVKNCSGFRPPSQSFLLSSSSRSWASLLQSGSVLVDIPLVDRSYYGSSIDDYAAELRAIGVKSEYSEACEFIGSRLMSLAGSGNLTRENVLSILGFIKFLRKECLSPKEFIESIRDGNWLRTTLGDKSPTESVWYDDTWQVASQISDIPFVDVDHYGRETIKSFKSELELLSVLVSSYASHCDIIVDNLKQSYSLARISSQAFLLLMECMAISRSPEKVTRSLIGTQCLKTNLGYKSPGKTVLCDPIWACLFKVFDGIPLVDSVFYGKAIYDFKEYLKKIGVVVDFKQAVKEFAEKFREHASNRSVSKQNVLSLLSAYKELRINIVIPEDFANCVRDVKWIRTRHCDYLRSPKECILYSSEWNAISPIVRVPFIDDTENGYGISVLKFREELKRMGSVVDFKSGVEFIASSLHFHDIDVKSITRETALSLLDCVQILSEKKKYEFSQDFTAKLSQPWLKTYLGYKSPKECLLFGPEFATAGLKKTDGPFIDEEFYGPSLNSYKGVLGGKVIGVTLEAEKGCTLIAAELESITEFAKILRIYVYLERYDWEPKSEMQMKIWIPHGSDNGKWVYPKDCVISDRSCLFSSQLIVLEKHYKKNQFFLSTAFKVKSSPDTEDYFKLWKIWEDSDNRSLSQDECIKFWGFISKNLNSKTDKTLPEKFVKVPVKLRDSNEIVLVNKKDVFIADDLQLKDLFERSFSVPIFVWYPQPSSPSLSRTKLLEVFQKVGVRTISESVRKQKEKVEAAPNELEVFRREIPSSDLIGTVLLKLILGFLALKMEAEERHRLLGDLLKLRVFETNEPIEVGYDLTLSSGEIMSVKASRSVRWERETSTIYTQKKRTGNKDSPATIIERATNFCDVIAEGVMWKSGEYIYELAELLKIAFLLDFDGYAVDFLMKSKNLQVFVEDEKFLSSSFQT